MSDHPTNGSKLSDRQIRIIVLGVLAGLVFLGMLIAGIVLDDPDLVRAGASASGDLVEDLSREDAPTPADP